MSARQAVRGASPGEDARPGEGARPGEDASPGKRGSGRPAPGLVGQILLVLLSAGYAIGAVLGWGSPRVAAFMGDFGLSLAGLVACVSCVLYARRSRTRFRPAWLLFAFSSVMAAGGNAVWGWYEVVLQQSVPVPGLADLFFLLFAPPAIVGLLVLAKRPVTRAGWACLALDSWLIGGSLLTLSWSLALAHTTQFRGESVPRAALSLAYPLLDIALVSMVLALHFKRSSAGRFAINTAVGAFALTVLCDALFTSPLLRDSYRSGQLLDAGWFAGSLLLAYAPWVRSTRRVPAEEPVRTSPDARARTSTFAALTPYLAAAVCTLGLLYSAVNAPSVDRVVLITACTVVLALVLRQGIMLVDNIALTQELAHKEEHFRSLVQGSSDVIMIVAPSGVLRYVSPAASGVYGREAESMLGCELASLIHPEDLGQVVHEIRRFLAADPGAEPTTRIECRFKSGCGDWLNVESTVNRLHGGLILNSRDVTERVRLQAQLQHNAEHDPLTDLPNRALFTRRVRRALKGRRTGDTGVAVLFIDLDGFKGVNDSIGHQAGDELLVQAARRLHESVRSGDTAARLGGDEFAALIVGDGSRDVAAREQQIKDLAERLRVALSLPYTIEGQEVRIAASIGVAFAENGLGAGELLRNADLAMYRAKGLGKDRVELYVPQLQTEAARRTALAGRLRTALDEGEFALLHQPVVCLHTGAVDVVTAEARWRSAQGILFTPEEFLRGPGDGERGGALGRWLLGEAVAQAAERRGEGHTTPVSVRLGARALLDRATPLTSVEALLTRYALPAGALQIALRLDDPRVPLEALERRLNVLRRLGVRIGLDGFGAGHATIEALRRLPVDALTLDRGLVGGVVDSARHYKITAGVLRIATDLGLYTVAEGVDRAEQVTVLQALGCTHAQGLAFSGPLDEHRLRRALAHGSYPLPGRRPEPVRAAAAARPSLNALARPVRHTSAAHHTGTVPLVPTAVPVQVRPTHTTRTPPGGTPLAARPVAQRSAHALPELVAETAPRLTGTPWDDHAGRAGVPDAGARDHLAGATGTATVIDAAPGVVTVGGGVTAAEAAVAEAVAGQEAHDSGGIYTGTAALAPGEPWGTPAGQGAGSSGHVIPVTATELRAALAEAGADTSTSATFPSAATASPGTPSPAAPSPATSSTGLASSAVPSTGLASPAAPSTSSPAPAAGIVPLQPSGPGEGEAAPPPPVSALTASGLGVVQPVRTWPATGARPPVVPVVLVPGVLPPGLTEAVTAAGTDLAALLGKRPGEWRGGARTAAEGAGTAQPDASAPPQ
ncbi:EAL domain-containing protein [Streptomyces sp. NPDC002248]